MNNDEKSLLHTNEELLKSIHNSDYSLYKNICDEYMTAFEPEGKSLLIEGLNFHK
jgi:coproporphyrinogen III oxidase